MRNLIIIAILIVTAIGCKKAEELRYGSRDNIYLDLMGSERDSLIYTFAYNPALAEDTVWIPVRISGIRTDAENGADRKFILKAEKDSSTAQPSLHYKDFDPYYVINKGTGFTWVPLVIYSQDPELTENSVTLHFRLYPSEDFDVNIPKLSVGKLVFSNKLERPNWWGMWFGGYYSRVKHEFFIITTGLTELSMDGLDAPKNLYFVSVVSDFLSNPIKWVEKNPGKGYVITPKAGTPDYEFYSVSNPAKKILYRKSPQTGLHYFIDEFGNEVQ